MHDETMWNNCWEIVFTGHNNGSLATDEELLRNLFDWKDTESNMVFQATIHWMFH